MRKWYDIELQTIVTEDELRDEFSTIRNDGEHNGWTFEDYVDACMTRHNGTLEDVEQDEIPLF